MSDNNITQVNDVKASGKVTLSSVVTYSMIDVHGKLESDGNLICSSFVMNGKAYVPLQLLANTISCKGKIQANSIRCNEFYGTGNVEAKTVDADKFTLVLASRSKIQKLSAKNIMIEAKEYTQLERSVTAGIFELFHINYAGEKDSSGFELIADEIHGNSVVLENTKAKLVIADHVIIKRNCQIDTLLYSSDYSCESTSDIMNIRKNTI